MNQFEGVSVCMYIVLLALSQQLTLMCTDGRKKEHRVSHYQSHLYNLISQKKPYISDDTPSVQATSIRQQNVHSFAATFRMLVLAEL
jgi:hypothetical protein